MSWDRAAVAKALATQLEAAVPDVTVYDRPRYNLNAPAIVVGHAAETRYSTHAMTIDDTQLPVTCVAGTEREDDVADLIADVRTAVLADVTLGGAVQSATPLLERNWRPLKVAGADLLAADVVLQVYM
jgi:hypothetical protein